MLFQIFAAELIGMVEKEVEKASVRIFDNIGDDHKFFLLSEIKLSFRLPYLHIT